MVILYFTKLLIIDNIELCNLLINGDLSFAPQCLLTGGISAFVLPRRQPYIILLSFKIWDVL